MTDLGHAKLEGHALSRIGWLQGRKNAEIKRLNEDSCLQCTFFPTILSLECRGHEPSNGERHYREIIAKAKMVRLDANQPTDERLISNPRGFAYPQTEHALRTPARRVDIATKWDRAAPLLHARDFSCVDAWSAQPRHRSDLRSRQVRHRTLVTRPSHRMLAEHPGQDPFRNGDLGRKIDLADVREADFWERNAFAWR